MKQYFNKINFVEMFFLFFTDDETRVVLTSLKDDYINASWINVSLIFLTSTC